MKTGLLLFCLLVTSASLAQENIASGTILPVRLNSGINTKNVKAGREVTARLMQDVPLGAGARLKAGSKVIGHVLAVKRAENHRGASLSLRFDQIRSAGNQIAVTTNLRALASPLDVDQAQIPKFGPDRGTPAAWWTTEQIGGDVVYRGDGPVTSGSRVVGTPALDGVLVDVSNKIGSKCRGDFNNLGPQALWVFSSDACGIYGYENLNIDHAGRTQPTGEIQLNSDKGNVNLRVGTGLLLRVQ